MFIFPNASNLDAGEGQWLKTLGVDWVVINKNNIPVQLLCNVI
jgi:hypothetical protein